MKVLHLAPPSRGGDTFTAHSFIDEEIAALREAGVECHVLSDVQSRSAVRDGVRVHGLSGGRAAAKLRHVAKLAYGTARHVPWLAARNPREFVHALRIEAAAADLVREEEIDLIHSHFGWPAGFGGSLAAVAAGVPVVASLRGMDLLIGDDIGYGLRRDASYHAALVTLLASAARTVYATEFMKREGVALGASTKRAVVVRKGADLQRFRPARDPWAEARALGLEPPVILAVGSLGPRKGYGDLLDALGQLTDLPWSLALCGDGPERHALEARARLAGIGQRVQFCGSIPRDRIARYFSAADVFVHPALIEAAGNVVLEALASACAVVVTKCGGPAEYIREDDTGLIVPPSDPAALGAALRRLLGDDARRQQMGMSARRSAETSYNYARMIRDLSTVYEEALDETAVQARRSSSCRPSGLAPPAA